MDQAIISQPGLWHMADQLLPELSEGLVDLEWDVAKNESNIAKHGIDFDHALTISDDEHFIFSSDRALEKRWLAVGKLEAKLIAVIFTVRGNKVRIISARRARKHEERAYRDKGAR